MAIHTILLVDDDDDIRAVGEMALSSVGGFQLFTARSGSEALERAAEVGPDLIILDVMMPGMDGPETLSRLGEDPRTGAIPVIFLTAKAQPAEVRRLEQLGALGVLTKPFDPMLLPDQVRRLTDVGGGTGPSPEKS